MWKSRRITKEELAMIDEAVRLIDDGHPIGDILSQLPNDAHGPVRSKIPAADPVDGFRGFSFVVAKT